MNSALRGLLGKLDRVPESVWLWGNVALAFFVALAHGGALAVTFAKPTPIADEIRQLAMISLPIAGIVILTAAAALIGTNWRRRVLGIHGIVLAGSAAALLVWSSGILLAGIPDGNFSWWLGFLTAWVVYSFFILSRFTLPVALRIHAAILYAPLVALVVALPIDIGVFIRLVGKM